MKPLLTEVFRINEVEAKRTGEDFSVKLSKQETFALMICLHDYTKANPGKQVYGINPDDLFKALKDQLGGVKDEPKQADPDPQSAARMARRSGIR